MIGFQRDVVLVWWANSDDWQHHGQVMVIGDRQGLGLLNYMGQREFRKQPKYGTVTGTVTGNTFCCVKTAFAYNNNLQQLLDSYPPLSNAMDGGVRLQMLFKTSVFLDQNDHSLTGVLRVRDCAHTPQDTQAFTLFALVVCSVLTSTRLTSVGKVTECSNNEYIQKTKNELACQT